MICPNGNENCIRTGECWCWCRNRTPDDAPPAESRRSAEEEAARDALVEAARRVVEIASAYEAENWPYPSWTRCTHCDGRVQYAGIMRDSDHAEDCAFLALGAAVDALDVLS